MTDPNKRAVGLLRDVKDRVVQLEQQVSTSEGLPNLLEFVTDTSEASDDVTATTEAAGGFQWDQDSWDQERWQ